MSESALPRGKSKPPTPWKPSKKLDNPNAVPSLNGRWGYLFTAPFFIMFLIFGLAPIVFSVVLAFFDVDVLSGIYNPVGLANFTELFADSRFWNALVNTFDIWLISTIPMIIMSIGLAAILHNPFLKGSTFWRTILLVPNITSVLAIAIVFGQLFGRDFGMINIIIGALGFEHVDFIQGTTIPSELYESASLDGAGKWKQFIYVTLPGLRNTITFVLIVGTIGGLQVFAEPLILGGSYNGGDSGQFSTLTLFLFDQAFVGYRWGYAAAIGIAITLIVMIVSTINFFITRRIAGDKS
ncbi:MAG: sugar ABC transporter permease [Actinobacteria bacterium]|nr:sugar ABC transporter permease [Actinomycetota bacterium]